MLLLGHTQHSFRSFRSQIYHQREFTSRVRCRIRKSLCHHCKHTLCAHRAQHSTHENRSRWPVPHLQVPGDEQKNVASVVQTADARQKQQAQLSNTHRIPVAATIAWQSVELCRLVGSLADIITLGQTYTGGIQCGRFEVDSQTVLNRRRKAYARVEHILIQNRRTRPHTRHSGDYVAKNTRTTNFPHRNRSSTVCVVRAQSTKQTSLATSTTEATTADTRTITRNARKALAVADVDLAIRLNV